MVACIQWSTSCAEDMWRTSLRVVRPLDTPYLRRSPRTVWCKFFQYPSRVGSRGSCDANNETPITFSLKALSPKHHTLSPSQSRTLTLFLSCDYVKLTLADAPSPLPAIVDRPSPSDCAGSSDSISLSRVFDNSLLIFPLRRRLLTAFSPPMHSKSHRRHRYYTSAFASFSLTHRHWGRSYRRRCCRRR